MTMFKVKLLVSVASNGTKKKLKIEFDNFQ